MRWGWGIGGKLISCFHTLHTLTPTPNCFPPAGMLSALEGGGADGGGGGVSREDLKSASENAQEVVKLISVDVIKARPDDVKGFIIENIKRRIAA